MSKKKNKNITTPEQNRRIGRQQEQQKKQVEEAKQKKQKKILLIGWSSVLVVGVLAIVLWLVFQKKPKEPEKPKRFAEVEHISVDIYQAFLDDRLIDALSKEDKEQFEKFNLEYNIYVFVYNPDYEECEACERLEVLIMKLHNKEDKNYSFFVMNYEENKGIEDIVTDSFLPNFPVFIHILGDKVDKVNTIEKDIRTEINKAIGE